MSLDCFKKGAIVRAATRPYKCTHCNGTIFNYQEYIDIFKLQVKRVQRAKEIKELEAEKKPNCSMAPECFDKGRLVRAETRPYKCTHCDGSVYDRKEYREHFRAQLMREQRAREIKELEAEKKHKTGTKHKGPKVRFDQDIRVRYFDKDTIAKAYEKEEIQNLDAKERRKQRK